jgi:hypothetical protein
MIAFLSASPAPFTHTTATCLRIAVRNGHFTLIKLQYRYQGRNVTDIRGLAHVGAYYSWYIIGPGGL